MLPLKYLFNNTNLAEMILENWDYDKEDDTLFSFWRISSNAVYGFKQNGMPCYLRFTPCEESSENRIIAELDYINYLISNKFPANKPITSNNSREFELVHTPWGDYFAVAFLGVKGRDLESTDPSEELYHDYGRFLGRLHNLSMEYTHKTIARPDFQSQLDWMVSCLEKVPGESSALRECEIISQALSSLPRTKNKFGLIHYDFELDNVFYDSGLKAFSVIDFDDCHNHFFAADVEQALHSIRNDGPGEEFARCFLVGYKEVSQADSEMHKYFPFFRRYADLYGYVRILRATSGTWLNEPQWMNNLRQRIEGLKERRSLNFGKPINF